MAALLRAVPTVAEPEPFFLDFAGAPPATGSFLRECVLGFRKYVRAQGLPVYPVVANASGATIEELTHLLEMLSDALPTCLLDADDRVTEPRIIGALDAAQQRTLDAVIEAGSATATALAEKFSDEKVGTTAWNNRLVALAQKGLLIERTEGRAKTYEPVLKGL